MFCKSSDRRDDCSFWSVLFTDLLGYLIYLIRIFIKKAADDGEQHDLQVKRDTPVSKVIEIAFNALVNRSVAAPAIHLSPTRNSDLEDVSPVVSVDIL